MIVKTSNSTYQVSGTGFGFEVRKVSDTPGTVAKGDAFFGDSFVLKVGESLVLFDGNRQVLETSTVVAVLG